MIDEFGKKRAKLLFRAVNDRGGVAEVLQVVKNFRIRKGHKVELIVKKDQFAAPAPVKKVAKNEDENFDIVEDTSSNERESKSVFSPIRGKRFQLTVDALGAALGITIAELNIRLGDKFSFGPSYWLFDVDSDSDSASTVVDGSAYGVQLKYYFGDPIGPGYNFSAFGGKLEGDIGVTVLGFTTIGEIDSTYLGLSLNYQWLIGSLTIGLGAGAALFLSDVSENIDDDQVDVILDGVLPVINLNVGLAF